MTRATGVFSVVGGIEQGIHEDPSGVRLTRVSGTQRFEGSVVGDGSVDWVFCYQADRSARFVGFQRIQGVLDKRSGSFVMESVGDHDGKTSRGRWRVVPGSGAGELTGITGQGAFEAAGGRDVSYQIDYQLG